MKRERRPLIDPLLMLLKSRRVLISLVTLLFGVAVMLLPDLAPLTDEILVLLLTLALALIGGYTLEDAVQIARQQPLPPDELESLIRLIIEAILNHDEEV
ncbi:MAG: hypothetical protein CUN56_08960 [Phototrophicales bacterium]|nr:MAG: hypothetical protein CUN56_08960 [Phototrophicales bacterium]